MTAMEKGQKRLHDTCYIKIWILDKFEVSGFVLARPLPTTMGKIESTGPSGRGPVVIRAARRVWGIGTADTS